MGKQEFFRHNASDSLAVIDACFSLTDQYRSILQELGEKHQLSENEMLVLVHLASNPNACTQKKLQATNLHLSVSSICRMVESLRRKGYLTTRMDENDRRSWILHLERKGEALAEEFSLCLGRRLDDIFTAVPSFDSRSFLSTMSRASAAANNCMKKRAVNY